MHVQKEKHSSSWLGNSVRWFVVHEHVNIHISLSLLWDLCTQQCEKVCSANRGECVTAGGFYRPTHLCVAHFVLHKNVWQFFSLWCGKVGVVHVSGGRVFVWGFREGRGDLSSGLSQSGGKSCCAVWRSGLWCSGTVFLILGAGRDCGKDGLVPQTWHNHFWHITFLISKKEDVGPKSTLIWDIIL